MKFGCLGCMEAGAWERMSKDEQDAFVENCFAYDKELLQKGHWIDSGVALQGAATAKTLRWKDSKVLVTDGPFTETKEQLGGIGVLEAKDMDEAIALMSKHPGVCDISLFEIRPIDEASVTRQADAVAKLREEGRLPAHAHEGTAKFACMGHIGTPSCGGPSVEGDFDAMLKECSDFDEARHEAGQWLAGIGLQPPNTAKTLRSKGGKVVVTDGPYAETKEWLGGIVVLALKDMNEAVELLSKHPALRYGVVIEIRPINEAFDELWESVRDGGRQDAAGRREVTVA